ncbi:MAG: polysaccharide deacetylase family protein [Minisyncoccia bacterium]
MEVSRLYLKPVPTSLSHLFLRFPLIVAPIVIALFLLAPGQEKMPEAIVTICFDDGYRSTYEIAYPILKQYGYPATLFVIPKAVGEEGYMTLNQLRILSNNGWEIGSHTYSHQKLTTLPASEVERELKRSKEWLEERGLKVYSFAYPYGAYNESVIEKVKKYYSVARIGEGIFNNLPLRKDEIYKIKALDVNAPFIKSIDDLKKIIDQAKVEKKWLVLIFHRVGEKETETEYNVSPQFLEETVKYLKQLGFKGVRIEF